MTIVDLTGQDRFLGIFLAVKANRLAFKVVQALVKCAGLGNTGVGGQIAPQNCHAAAEAKGIAQRTDGAAGVGIEILVGCDIFTNGMAGDRHLIIVQMLTGQVLHHAHHAAVMEEVNDVEIAGGVHLGHLGRGAGQFVELREHIDLQLCLVGNGGQMHNRIGRAAHGHAGLDGIANAAISDDLPCGNFLFYQLHDLHAGLLSQSQTTSRGSGSQAGVRQGHA